MKQRKKARGDIDQTIGKDSGVIPLVNQKFTYVHGSSVKGYSENQLFGRYPDLATIAVR